MNTLAKILLTLNAIDLVAFPFYMVWIIRKGVWLYGFQQFHRAFHLAQLPFFVWMFLEMTTNSQVVIIIFAVYFATCLQHNFKLHQFLTPNATHGDLIPYQEPFAMMYLDIIRNEGAVLSGLYRDISTNGVFVKPEEVDILCLSHGKRWKFIDYMKNYGERLACDALAVVLILVFLV
jgi:hypothetical protein